MGNTEHRPHISILCSVRHAAIAEYSAAASAIDSCPQESSICNADMLTLLRNSGAISNGSCSASPDEYAHQRCIVPEVKRLRR